MHGKLESGCMAVGRPLVEIPHASKIAVGFFLELLHLCLDFFEILDTFLGPFSLESEALLP